MFSENVGEGRSQREVLSSWATLPSGLSSEQLELSPQTQDLSVNGMQRGGGGKGSQKVLFGLVHGDVAVPERSRCLQWTSSLSLAGFLRPCSLSGAVLLTMENISLLRHLSMQKPPGAVRVGAGGERHRKPGPVAWHHTHLVQSLALPRMTVGSGAS